MDPICPICLKPADVQRSPDGDGVLLSACPTCHVNLLMLPPQTSEEAPSPATGLATAPSSGSTPVPPRTRRLARWLSVSTVLVNLSIIAALLLASIVSMRAIYDPYNVDEHAVTPFLLRISGWTDLHLASARGQTDEVTRLIAAGADVHGVTGKGRTALFEAAARGHAPVVTLLIDHGADPNAADEGGATALMAATRHGHEAPVKVLVARGAALDIKSLVLGNTALHVAAQGNHDQAARHLLAGGAQVDSRNANLETPLHVAARQPWHEDGAVALLLIDSQADLEARDQQGFTPLIRAAQQGNLPVLAALITRQADPNAKTHDGWSALYLASRAGEYRVAKILLDQEADPNARCDCNMTPLHQAVRSGDDRLVTLLLERGAEVNAKVGGKTALHVAQDRQLHAVAVVLREHGGRTFPALAEHVSRARDLSKRNEHAEAAAQYSRALELDPTDPELYYLRAMMRLKLRQYPSAYDDLERSLELDPTRFDAYIKVAAILSLRQDWDGIVAHWDRLLAREPHHARALYERGRARFRKWAYGHDAAARDRALADTLLSCQLGYQEGCQTYTNTTGKRAA